VTTAAADTWEDATVVDRKAGVFTVVFRRDEFRQDVGVDADWLPVSLPANAAAPVEAVAGEPRWSGRTIDGERYVYHLVAAPGGGVDSE
jgi:hypothetical protein